MFKQVNNYISTFIGTFTQVYTNINTYLSQYIRISEHIFFLIKSEHVYMLRNSIST